MSDAVSDLGQQLLAAAWDATRILDDPKVQAQRFGENYWSGSEKPKRNWPDYGCG